MLTEDQARVKWCPMARVAPEGDQNVWNRSRIDVGAQENVHQRPDRVVAMSRCIGSDCMAWRWLDPASDPAVVPESARRGFCGLAGRPTP